MPAAYLTTVEAEKISGVNRRRLATLAQEGKLHPIQRVPGGRYFWNSAELLAMGRPETSIDYERIEQMIDRAVAKALASIHFVPVTR